MCDTFEREMKKKIPLSTFFFLFISHWNEKLICAPEWQALHPSSSVFLSPIRSHVVVYTYTFNTCSGLAFPLSTHPLYIHKHKCLHTLTWLIFNIISKSNCAPHTNFPKIEKFLSNDWKLNWAAPYSIHI